MNYVICNDTIRALISSDGAEMISVNCGGERLWQNQTGEWAGHAPVLFPVCGNCGMRVDGKAYPLERHGFARTSAFELRDRGGDFVSFALRSNELTKRRYPYDFELTVGYRLKENAVEVIYGVKNTGARPMYFSCGSHESYALDGDIDEYELRFDKAEELAALLHDGNGLLTGEKKALCSDGRLVLKSEYFEGGNTLIFSELQSKSAALFHRSGRAVARVDFGGFQNFLIWKNERARMICLEPWLNLPDGLNDKREFAQKEGVRCLPPDGEARFTHTVTYF